jgi:methyl-accepting chemotaxis protein
MQFFANISWIFTILMGVILATIIGYSVTNRLREVLKRILSTSNEIDGLLKTQTSLTSEQVSSVKDATSSLKGLNRSFKHTEELALDSSNRCKNSLHVSEKGNKLIKQMLEGLIQHKDKVLAIGQHVLRLTEITKQIHNIAAVTGNITNQTNILALNAAVQAAQVKQHSESFSVIASEIRKLADESKKFLLQIDVLAEDIKSATDSTMQIADEGNKTVQECIKLAQSSTEAFNAIISITTDSFVGAEQVSKNVKQQSSAVERVTEALDLANTSTGKTLQGMDQTRKELENLNLVSEELKTIV